MACTQVRIEQSNTEKNVYLFQLLKEWLGEKLTPKQVARLEMWVKLAEMMAKSPALWVVQGNSAGYLGNEERDSSMVQTYTR